MEVKKVNKVESLKKVENIEKVKMIGYANVNTLTWLLLKLSKYTYTKIKKNKNYPRILDYMTH